MMPFPTPQIAFRTTFSLEYLFDFWKQRENHSNPVLAQTARQVGRLAQEHPELAGPLEDLRAVTEHQMLLAPLFSSLLPTATFETDVAAVSTPFGMQPVYSTPAFDAMMEAKSRSHKHDVKSSHEILLTTWRFALAQLYGMESGLPIAPVFQQTDEQGLPRFARVQINLDFCRVLAVGPLPESTPEFRRQLLEASNDPGCLARLLPPSSIEFRGFVVLQATDITGHEIVSRLKFLLIDDNALTGNDNYAAIENLVRGALRKPAIDVTLVAFRGEQVLMLQQELMTGEECILQASALKNKADFTGTVYGSAYYEDRPISVTDLSSDTTDPHLGDLWKLGVRSVLVIPLKLGDGIVGLALLASPDPLGVNVGDLDSLSDIVPLLALGVRRSVESLDRRVQQIIQTHWTSIHPSVAWKFQAEASNAIVSGSQAINPIVFENVSPLYAVSDIRNSSVQRAISILADLSQQLELGLAVVEAARKDRDLPLLDELVYRIAHQKTLLSDGLNTGDEISVMNFLRRDLEPLFPDLARHSTRAKLAADAYQQAIHHEAHSLYVRRRAFDESVQLLNRSISDFLDKAQVEAQAMFPHYFDKTTTDGVDHTIYIGASLVESGQFDPMYLQNLKLWQFMTLCRIARLTNELKPTLPVPLDMTHLIMVQDLPITIRFNNDEKRFAVDGAYNIRYEIMKKRIDKAVVKTTGERLTQPNRIAIVYSQEEESRDYRRYIAFLRDKGWLEQELEELELEDLQGIHGLKALRVTVRTEKVEPTVPVVEISARRRRPVTRPRVSASGE